MIVKIKTALKKYGLLRRIYYGSVGVKCPICDYRGLTFNEAGVPPRKNAQCPECSSAERHRLFYLFCQENKHLFFTEEKIKLLHFAPFKQFFTQISSRSNIEYFPCDIEPEIYRYAGGKKLYKVDMTSIPFEANSFDSVLNSHVLEHIPNDRLAMKEVFRVLKPKGKAFFMVPMKLELSETYEDPTIIDPESRQMAFGQSDHVRWYGMDFKNRLEEAGFKVKEYLFYKNFSARERFKYGIQLDEPIYIGEKIQQ